MSAQPLATMALQSEGDVFVARQLGRDCAAGLGLDRLDALRVATAISELGREVVAGGGGVLNLTLDDTGSLAVSLTAEVAAEHWHDGLASAARLVDAVAPATDTSVVGVTLTKRIPDTSLTTSAMQDELRRHLRAQTPVSLAEELREQNRDLITALEEVRAQKAQLEVVNRELEETNRGVLALYTELSAELDRTNQGVVALYAEIDDKNSQLREVSEAKSRFLRSISHELRTPVNSVLGLTGLLLDPGQVDPLSAEHTEQVEFIRASARDLLRLVEALLDLAKAESGRLEAVMGTVSVPELFAELRGTTEPILRPGVTLVTDPGDVDVLVTDPNLLRHVLRNLLSNAAKFTPEGHVELSAAQEGEEVVLAVRDTGVGIGEEDQRRIFEEFYQARTPLHVSAKGTGLGLPLTVRIANALGGRIDLESVPGEGSRFSLRLPRDGSIGGGDA
jgi:signal transduction histidine kinase